MGRLNIVDEDVDVRPDPILFDDNADSNSGETVIQRGMDLSERRPFNRDLALLNRTGLQGCSFRRPLTSIGLARKCRPQMSRASCHQDSSTIAQVYDHVMSDVAEEHRFSFRSAR